jgi:hypothetical protein
LQLKCARCDARRTLAALREAPLSSDVVEGLAEVLAAY